MSIENTFHTFGLSKEILDSLSLLDYKTPTEIQEKAIPPALAGKNIIAKSQTGTGKTAAFAIPICENILWDDFLPQALVLEPTRELAYQVKTEIFHIGRMKRLKVPVLLGGMPIEKQFVTLKQRNHIIVGTPGRILDHVRRETLPLNHIKYLVIDEADLMLNMGFMDEVEEIIRLLPEEKISMLFSATLSEEILVLSKKWIQNPEIITIEQETQTVASIKEEVYFTANEDKYQNFLSVLINENPQNAMIFCATREMVNTLYQKLKRAHINCGMLHGELDQRIRLKSIDDFKEGRYHYLICTDIAARGIDFDNITHVFHYDFPTGKETYVHRTGRTGRNGKTGISISFVTPEEERMLKAVIEYTKQDLEEKALIPFDKTQLNLFLKNQEKKGAVQKPKGAAFSRSIVKLSIGGGKKSKIRAVDIVGTICSIPTLDASDIGIIDIRDSISYVEILNNKGSLVFDTLQTKPIKGKIRKVQKKSSAHNMI